VGTINEPDSTLFKAMPLNKKMFERPSRLPEVKKKGNTDFEEFALSQTNRKSTLLPNDEIRTEFKALPLNTKILQDQVFRPTLNAEDKPSLDSKPFNFKTEERLKHKKKAEDSDYVAFKAREMPKYKFFEPKKDHKELDGIQF
jgi:hypothetical protein